ncbi:MAG TPA: M48 family metallopeptidase, partial [bacterium]|nr:M48 family metallopeptidase [bacterium]
FRRGGREDYLRNKEKARALVVPRLDYFNQFYNFKFRRLSIRDQRSRWGSCSRNGGLNFNYRLVFLPPNLADYLIVHELCHLGEFNHSPAFWKLVARTIPDYENRRRLLRKL